MMIRRSLVTLALLAFALCLDVPPIMAQAEGSAVTIEGVRFPVTFKSHEIPEFSVVSHFFRRISMIRNHAHVYEKFLTDIGIESGSQAADFLDDVTGSAIEVLNINTVDGSLTGEAFEEHQYHALREKAGKLGIIHRNLLLGLEEAGVSTELLKSYCEETIRPSIKMLSTELDNTRYMKSVAEFDKQLKNL